MEVMKLPTVGYEGRGGNAGGKLLEASLRVYIFFDRIHPKE